MKTMKSKLIALGVLSMLATIAAIIVSTTSNGSGSFFGIFVYSDNTWKDRSLTSGEIVGVSIFGAAYLAQIVVGIMVLFTLQDVNPRARGITIAAAILAFFAGLVFVNILVAFIAAYRNEPSSLSNSKKNQGDPGNATNPEAN